jgi:VanZ family protein
MGVGPSLLITVNAFVPTSLRSIAESLPGRVVPPFVWMAVIFFLSHQPTIDYPAGLDAKVVSTFGHIGVFAVLSVLIWWALGLSRLSLGRRAVLSVLLSLLYGLTDEWHQSFVPGRTPDMMDIVADTFGATMAMLAVTWLARRCTPGSTAEACLER